MKWSTTFFLSVCTFCLTALVMAGFGPAIWHAIGVFFVVLVLIILFLMM